MKEVTNRGALTEFEIGKVIWTVALNKFKSKSGHGCWEVPVSNNIKSSSSVSPWCWCLIRNLHLYFRYVFYTHVFLSHLTLNPIWTGIFFEQMWAGEGVILQFPTYNLQIKILLYIYKKKLKSGNATLIEILWRCCTRIYSGPGAQIWNK